METENAIIVGMAGMQYQFDENSDIGKKIIEKLIPGAGILLIREKDNRFDKNAVAIYLKETEQKIGYISRYKNKPIAELIDNDTKYVAFICDNKKKIVKTRTENSNFLVEIIFANCDNNECSSLDGGIHLEEEKKIRNKIQLLKEKANNGKFAEVFEWELRVFAIDLVNADKKITWQEVEILQNCIGVILHPETFIIKRKFENFESVVYLEKEYYDSYIEIFADLGQYIISCDGEITNDEIRKLDEYNSKLKGLLNEQTEDELNYIKEEYSLINFKWREYDIGGMVLNYVNSNIKKYLKKDTDYSKILERYKNIFGCSYDENNAQEENKFNDINSINSELCEVMKETANDIITFIIRIEGEHI